MGLNELAKKIHENAVAHGWWEPEFNNGEVGIVVTALQDLGCEELGVRAAETMRQVRTFGDIISLCHAELSESLEEFRNGRTPTSIYYSYENSSRNCKGCLWFKKESPEPELSCVCSDGKPEPLKGKPEGIPVELADVIIRILDYCGHEKIDIEQAVAIKMRYNETREYRHGGKKI